MTRLADVTRLDRIGLPVWQAIRPMSRALSVHQGKGATDADAQLGALLEAVESNAAEQFAAKARLCCFEELPVDRRAPTISDLAADRKRSPSALDKVPWVEATDLKGDHGIFLPFELVSLDCTLAVPSAFDRVSNGIATGATREEALVTALQEFIERDSVMEWKSAGPAACMQHVLDPDSVPYTWFELWRSRIAAADAELRCYHVPSITGSPVFACEINDYGRDGAAYRAIQGHACHSIPEVALFKAVAEAIQCRATYIAGSRDDLLPQDYEPPTHAMIIGFGLPFPPIGRMIRFDEVSPGPPSVESLAGALCEAGYPQIAVVDLARPHGLWVVRVFICGLGSLSRRRRAAW